jgi:hypothetical protein
MNNTVVKLLYDYLDLREISRLRPVCKLFRDLIDRDFDLLFKKEVNKLGPHNDINHLLMQVVRNRGLLIQVLQHVKNASGFVLESSGVALYAVLALFHPNDHEVTSLMNIPVVNMMGFDDRIGMAYRDELKQFKASYYSNEVPEGVPNMWSAIVTEYIHGLVERNTKDYQMNWEEIRKWNRTPFFRFIKGALMQQDYANILVGVSRLSNETIRRNKAAIIDFAREVFDPLIQTEINLIEDIQAGKPVQILGYKKSMNNRMPEINNEDMDNVSTYHRLKFVVTGSIIRAVLTTSALISEDLFFYFWETANQIFDFSEDNVIGEITRNAIVGNNAKVLLVLNINASLSLNITNVSGFVAGMIPLDYFDADPYQKLKLLLIRGDEVTAETLTDLGVSIADNPTDLYAMHNVTVPVYNVRWMNKKRCMKMLDILDDIGLWNKIPYFFDIFVTRDLEFWMHFATQYAQSIKADPNLMHRIVGFNIIMNNVDFIRFCIESEIFEINPQYRIIGRGWVTELIEEYNEKNTIQTEEDIARELIMQQGFPF